MDQFKGGGSTLHSAFEFGFNIHTLTYVLLILVVASGMVGIYIYLTVPKKIGENANGQSLEEMIERIAAINLECRETGAVLDDEVNRLIRRSAQKTQIGGNVWRQISGRYPGCESLTALQGITERGEHLAGAEAEANRTVVRLLARKQDLLLRVRRHIRYCAIRDLWLYFHTPLSIALIASLLAHIVAVFFYW